MDNFKLKYKRVGHFITVTNWMDERTARTWFDQLTEDLSCTWCELIYNPEDEDHIIDEFVR